MGASWTGIPVALGFCLSTVALAQVDTEALRAVIQDSGRADSVRFTALYDLVWDGYLFSDPDSGRILAMSLRQQARSKRNTVFEARASELIAATWYVQGDLKTALLHYDTALALHERNGDDDGYADVITNVASVRSFMGQQDTALLLYAEGLAIHERIQDSASVANDLNAIGRINMLRGDHVKAVDLYGRSLRIQEALGNERGVSTGEANLGALFMGQGDFRTGLDHYRSALRIAEKLGDKHMMGKDLEETGNCLEELGDTAAAMRDFLRSLALRTEIDDRHGLVNVQNRIAGLHFEQGGNAEALRLYEKSISLAREEDLPWGLGTALVGKGRILLATGRTPEALVLARQAEGVAAEAEEVGLARDASELRHAAARASGRWQEALEAHERAVLLNDSIMREGNQRAVLRNEYKYAYERQALADSLAHAGAMLRANAENTERLARAHRLRDVALAVGALLLVVALGIWQRSRLLRRTNSAILQAQARLVESEKAREASEVRTRIARDIHDQLGSDLTKLVMLGTEAKAMAQEDIASLPAIAESIERVAAEANRSLGDIVWAIDPHHDSLAGLTERVRAHCERMLRWSRVDHTIDCAHEGADRSLDPATKRDIYLVLREALNNAVKYAGAGHIQVMFRTSPAALAMEVKDDGIGLRAEGNGNGIRNMRARAQSAGARFELLVEGGTTVRLRLDFPA